MIAPPSRHRAAFAVLGFALAGAAGAHAQDSQFGIRGLGMPGRAESVRARSTGGAFAPFDPFSPLLEASLAEVRRVSASVTGGTSWRTVEAPTGDASLRGSRIPAFVIAGPIGRRLVFSAGFSTYLDKTFGVTREDTVTLRGQPVGVTDQITSDGAVADLRLALAVVPHERVALGVAVHGLTGSTRVAAQREFGDTAYLTSVARDEVAYGGIGVSASAVIDATSTVRLAAWVRNDAQLRADIRGTTVAENDLPLSYGAGVRLRPGREALIAAAVAWRQWAGAGPNAFDTFSWSVGVEAGSFNTPVRAGVRGGTLAFGPAGGSAPTEFAVAAGVGKQFSGGRGRLDFGIERLSRKGGGLTEQVWTFLLGLTVRP